MFTKPVCTRITIVHRLPLRMYGKVSCTRVHQDLSLLALMNEGTQKKKFCCVDIFVSLSFSRFKTSIKFIFNIFLDATILLCECKYIINNMYVHGSNFNDATTFVILSQTTRQYGVDI